MKRLMLTAVVLLVGGLAWAKAPLLPLYCYRFTKLDAAGGIAMPDNLGTGRVPLTLKLWDDSTSVPSMRDGNGNPSRGRFGTYSIQENNWSSFWLDATESGGLGCGAATGFAISLWFRPTTSSGDWSDFFSFRLGTEDYNFEYDNTTPRSFLVYSASQPSQHLRQRHGASWSAPTPVKVDQWNHLCLVWKPYIGWRSWPKNYGEVWLNGQKVAVLVSSNADDANDTCQLNTLYLGGWQQRGGTTRGTSAHTGIGEIAVYGCAISDDDVAYLYTHAPGPLPRGREMTVGLHFDRAYEDNVGGSPAMIANSGTLQVPIRLKGSSVDLTCEDSGATGVGRGIRLKGANGKWIEGDETTGLGASVNTGFTISYWTRPNSSVIAWSDLFSLGFDADVDFRHEFSNSGGGYGFYGDCWTSSVPGSEALNTWHHHVLTHDPDAPIYECQHWVDGKKAGTVNPKDYDPTLNLLRRICIGPTVLNENGGERCQGGSCNAGLDELAVYNYAMSDEEIAWLGTHEVALPPLAVTSLVRTISADGAWAGNSAAWALNGTTRKIVWPAGEDGAATAALTVNGTVNLAVDTLVQATNVVFAGSGTVALSVDENCRFAPYALTVGEGLTLTLPEGFRLSGEVRGSGTLAGVCDLTGTWAVELDGQKILDWPTNMDFSKGTVDVVSDEQPRDRYLVVRAFTGCLPQKVLYKGEDNKLYKMRLIDGDLYLVNTRLFGFRLILQ